MFRMAIQCGNASLYAFVRIFAKILNGPISLESDFFKTWVLLILRGNNTLYLLLLDSDRVFCSDRSILFVVIALPPSRFFKLITYGVESFLLVWFVSLGLDDRSSPIRG